MPPESEATIRLLKEDDLKRVRFLLGLGIMEQLATINNRGKPLKVDFSDFFDQNRKTKTAYIHPITLSIWIGLSSVFVTYMKWWPADNPSSSLLRFLSPAPAFAAVAVPIMFSFDWYQRDYFEKEVQEAIKGPDMTTPITHYNQSPASGFLVLSKEERVIGFIAIDATKSSTPSPTKNNNKLKKNETHEVAIIRHFFLDSLYRSTGVQEDLLNLAVSRAFTAKSAPLTDKVRIIDSDLQRYKRKAIGIVGFRRVREWDGEGPEEWSTGVFRRKFRWLEINRKEWEARQNKNKKEE
ncbi:hypothetical protein Clacol_002635 [Clathrus columnatus]|uniref:N-acetyltransferase domain-containing protein n=1 Tax=Clathrus columnatus TaxID=1419009 RepID=A0AAV5A599_9AGAM|nr:hypothetical protein Clacol_002635 [Clathrus columnatus]